MSERQGPNWHVYAFWVLIIVLGTIGAVKIFT